jgi:hypothetical protein
MTADEEDSGTLLLGGKRKGGKGNDGGSRVKRRVEGYGGDSGVYLPTTPKTGIVQWKSVVANEPVETSASLTFDVKASSNEIVRSVDAFVCLPCVERLFILSPPLADLGRSRG